MLSKIRTSSASKSSNQVDALASCCIYENTNVVSAGLVAFVPNGAILPRSSGVSDMPMGSPQLVPFSSPPNLERTFVLPHRGAISGMGIPRGITMIAGGGFHVSSLLPYKLKPPCADTASLG